MVPDCEGTGLLLVAEAHLDITSSKQEPGAPAMAENIWPIFSRLPHTCTGLCHSSRQMDVCLKTFKRCEVYHQETLPIGINSLSHTQSLLAAGLPSHR